VGRRIDVESTRTSAARAVDEVVAEAAAAVAAGARLVKVKIEPGWDHAPLTALRAALPGVPLAADANGAYAGCDPAALDWVGPLELAYLEQPLDPDDLVGHAHLQARLATTPLALDESVGSPGLLAAAVALGAGRRFSLKPSRLGGLLAAARAAATIAGCFVGGMFELGVGRAAALAVAALDVVELPSDLGPSDRYVEEDVTEPLVLDHHGDLIVPDGPGVGVDVRPERVAALASEVAELRP
jgi:O-succinylbenzoate synthase